MLNRRAQNSKGQGQYVLAHSDKDWSRFTREVREMGLEIQRNTDRQDYLHIKKIELWGRLCSLLGYASAWVIPNPISAYLISMGNFTRWASIFHPISHGALDRVKGIPDFYSSKKFARGSRRVFDWLDWITPNTWHTEHNVLHHYHLGTDDDPDVVRRNTKAIRDLNVPLFVKKIIAVGLACTWKFMYYAPNTLVEHRFKNGESPTNKITSDIWNPFKDSGRELWLRSILPYFTFRFVLIPMLFLLISPWAALFVLINSILAEFMTNFHSFVTIATNHTGQDIYTFDEAHGSQAEYYVRQIVGSVNFPTGSDLVDFFYGGMNYQIEHHLWPNASVRQYQKVQPQLKKLCAEFEIPYIQQPLRKRIGILWDSISVTNLKELKLGADLKELKC